MTEQYSYAIEIFANGEEYVASLDGSYSGGAIVYIHGKHNARQVAETLIEAGATLVIHKVERANE